MNRAVATRIALTVVICAVLIGILFVTPRAPPAARKSFTLVINGPTPVAGPSLISLSQGDRVTLHIKSSEAGHLEIHGYEQELDVRAGREATLIFVASRSGRFFVHLHTATEHIPVVAIEVQPR